MFPHDTLTPAQPCYTVAELMQRGFPWERYRLTLLDHQYQVVRVMTKRCSAARLSRTIRRLFPASRRDVLVYPHIDGQLVAPQILLDFQRVLFTYSHHQQRLSAQQDALIKQQFLYAMHVIIGIANTPET